MSETKSVTVFAASSILLALALKKRKRHRRNRVIWTRKWIQNRQSQGAFHQLLNELQQLDTSSYRNFVRMDAFTFEKLLCMVSPMITYQDTIMREAITPGERLAITLRFLATGMFTFLVINTNLQKLPILLLKVKHLKA